jgi:WD40 repeat protein
VRAPHIVAALAISPDGRQLATVEPARGTVWDVVAGQPLADLGRLHAAATTGLEQGAVAPAGGEQAGFLSDASDAGRRLAFSPDGRHLAVARGGNVVFVHDTRTWRTRVFANEGSEAVRSFVFHPRGEWLAVGQRHGLRLLDVATGSVRLSQAISMATPVDVSPDGRLLATIDATGSAQLWSVTDQDGAQDLVLADAGQVRRDMVRSTGFEDVTFGPDSRTLVIRDGGSVRMLELPEPARDTSETGSPDTAETWQETNRTVGARTITRTRGSLILTRDSTIDVWTDLRPSGPDTWWLAHASPVRTIGFSPDERWLLTLSEDRSLRVYDSRSFDDGAEQVDGAGVLFARFTPDARWLVVHARGELRLLRGGSWARVLTSRSGGDTVAVVASALTPDDRFLIAVHAGEVAVLRTADGTPVASQPVPGRVDDVRVSPDGRWLRFMERFPVNRAGRQDQPDRAHVLDLNEGRAVVVNAVTKGDSLAAGDADAGRLLAQSAEWQVIELVGPTCCTRSTDNGRWRAEVRTSHSPGVAIEPLQIDDMIAEACRRLRRSLTPAEWTEYLGDAPYHETCTASGAPASLPRALR